MSNVVKRKDLFRSATTGEKLSLFQFLFDTQALDADMSHALLKIIHRELGENRGYEHSLYKRYAESIEGLRFYMSDVLEEVVTGWRASRY